MLRSVDHAYHIGYTVKLPRDDGHTQGHIHTGIAITTQYLLWYQFRSNAACSWHDRKLFVINIVKINLLDFILANLFPFNFLNEQKMCVI